jgi:hypothetical protein
VSDDQQWRRPIEPTRPAGDSPDGQGTGGNPPAHTPPVYTGPPRTTPPSPDWRPRTLIQVPPPRRMPAQDGARLDSQEREARTITYGIGMVAGAVLFIVLIVLCARALF